MPRVTKQAVGRKSVRRKRTSSVIDRAVPIAEYEDPGFKINLYGRNGTGKTTLACTFPKPLLLMGFEDGTKSVRRVKGVKFLRVQATAQEIKADNEVCLEDLPELAKDTPERYRTVVLDTATSLQDLVLQEISGLDKVPVQSAWGAVTMDQYRTRSEKTREFMRLFLDLPMHVVVLAQEKDHSQKKEEGGGDSELIQPFMASALGITTCGWLHDNCDYICQTLIREEYKQKTVKISDKMKTIQRKTGKVEYCLRTLPHPIYASKLRVPRGIEIPDVIVDPDFGKIMELIQGG